MFTRIVVDIEIGWNLYDVPGARLPVVRQVHIVLVIVQGQAHLIGLASHYHILLSNHNSSTTICHKYQNKIVKVSSTRVKKFSVKKISKNVRFFI